MSIRPTVLDVPYISWKNLVQVGNLSVAHQITIRENRILVFAGNGQQLLRGMVAGNEYSDWVNNFQSESILVENEDEAISRLCKIELLNVTNSGVTLVSNVNLGKNTRWEVFENVPKEISNSSFTSIYVNNNSGIIYESIWTISKNDIYLQIYFDDQKIMELDLDELDSNFRLGQSSSHKGLDFSIMQYQNYMWCFKPTIPLFFESSFEIKMKKKCSQSRVVERGLISWSTI